jgi:hypothetical protein
MFLFAVQNVIIEHGPTVSAENLKPLPDSKIGKFNDHGDLFLGIQDMKEINKMFRYMNLSRLKFEIALKDKKKEDKKKAIEDA